MKKYILTLVTIHLMSLSYTAKTQCVQCDGNSSALGTYSSVLGMSSSTTNGSNGSFAGGYGSIADGTFAFAFGNQVTAAGTNSLAIGRFLETATTPAMILGTGSSPTSRLTNSTPNSLMIGFNSIKPTFFVSGAIGNGYTGKIGIGDITTPLAKLHIKGDANEDADILLMPNSNKYAAVKFGDVSGSSPNRIRALPSGDLDFFTASDFVFLG